METNQRACKEYATGLQEICVRSIINKFKGQIIAEVDCNNCGQRLNRLEVACSGTSNGRM